MKTTISKVIYTSFNLSETHIRSFVGTIERDIENIKITAKCEDSSEREFESLEELFQYDNIECRKIYELEFKFFSQQEIDTYISVQLSTLSINAILYKESSIFIHASGPDEVITQWIGKVEDRIIMWRPWHYKYSKFQGYHALMIIIGGIFASSYGYFIWEFYKLQAMLSSEEAKNWFWSSGLLPVLTGLLSSFVLAILICVISYGYVDKLSEILLNWRIRIFPSGFFCIGHQIDINDHLERRRQAFLSWVRKAIWAIFLGIGGLIYSLWSS